MKESATLKPRNKREERLLQAMQQEVPARYSSRTGRHRMVGLGVACLALIWAAAVICWYLAPSTTAMVSTFVLCGLALAIGVWVYGTLLLVSGVSGRIPEHLMDERQLQQRYRAHADAHRLTLLLVFVTFFLVMLMMGDADQVPAAALVVLFLALLATVAALPVLIASWKMPDPPAADEEA
jgi:hypothetical protein